MGKSSTCLRSISCSESPLTLSGGVTGYATSGTASLLFNVSSSLALICSASSSVFSTAVLNVSGFLNSEAAWVSVDGSCIVLPTSGFSADSSVLWIAP